MGEPTEADSGWVAKIGDFAHLYTDRHAPRLSNIERALPLSITISTASLCSAILSALRTVVAPFVLP